MKVQYFCLAFLSFIIGGSKAPASSAIDPTLLSGNISLTLQKGVWKLWQEKPVYQNITLDLVCIQGQCEPEVWGYAPQFNKDVDHRGAVTVTRLDNTWQLQVKMKIQSHPWQKTPLQEADYGIEILPHKGKLIGSYSGRFNDRTLRGKVNGISAPYWPKPIANHQPVKPRDHPRLIFRRDEVPTLREKAKTPAGQAILARLNQQLKEKVYYEGYVPNGGYHAAGHCFLSLLNDDKQAAETAWVHIEKSMEEPGRRIFEQGPIVAGVAIAYDLCYNSWSKERLRTVTRWLAGKILWLTNGDTPTRGWNSNPWSNWSARARSAAGLASLAILDEPDEFFFRRIDVRRFSKIAERNIQRYLMTAVGDRAFGTEGDHYTTEPWVLSLLAYLQAYRNVVGKDLVEGSSAEWFLPHYLTRILERDGELDVPTYGRSRRFGGGSIFTLGMGTVSERFLPGVMWLFRRHLGMEGDKTFGISFPYEAAFALKNYREDVTPQNPGKILDRVLADKQKGFYVFRDRWQDSNDFVASIYLKRQPLGGAWSYPDVGSFRIWGLGGRWANPGISDKDGQWTDENVAVVPKIRPWKYSKPIFFLSNPNGSGIVSLKTNDNVVTGSKSRAGIGLVRSFAVDYSGSSGASGLFAVVDKFEGMPEAEAFQNKTWIMNTEGKVTIRDSSSGSSKTNRTFTIESPNGTTMKGTFVAPSQVKISYQKTKTGGKILATGGNEFFVIMTVQKGQAPPVTISGKGLDAIVRVGKQTIHFGSDRLFLGVF
jgi:hypothetical protein